MYKELTSLLELKINNYDKDLKEVNNDIKEIKELYDVFNRYDALESAAILNSDSNKIDKLYNVLDKYNKLSNELMDKVYDLKMEYEEKYSNENVLRQKRGIHACDVLPFELMQRKKKADEITNLSIKMVEYNIKFIINRYNALIAKKEELKNERKIYEYARRNVKSNSKLIPRDIATINNLIYDIKDLDKQKELFDLLNDYIIYHIPKEKKKEEVTKITNNYVFVDNAIIKENKDEYDSINRNYLIALRCFDNYNDISMFLDSIKDKFNIKRAIEKIINLLNDDEKQLQNYLITYVNSIKEDEEDKIVDDKSSSNVILFTGFLEKKNKILNDCIKSDIPTLYYNDIYKGLNLIKENGGDGKRQNIVKRKKVFKLRINSIRITYKRLAKNVYIILGIFKKDDRWGQNIIETTIKRDKELVLVEESIIDSMKIDELWNEYVSLNNNMFEEINSYINPDKSCSAKKKMI